VENTNPVVNSGAQEELAVLATLVTPVWSNTNPVVNSAEFTTGFVLLHTGVTSVARTGGELWSSRRVSSSCYISDTRVEQHEPRSKLWSSGRVSSSCYTSDTRVVTLPEHQSSPRGSCCSTLPELQSSPRGSCCSTWVSLV
jgi:hypothetical protein